MNLEKVRFLDVVVPTREKGNYALYYDTKTRLVENVNLKNFILERKNKFDVEYLKGKYERDHHDFIFSQFDHKS